MRSTVQILCFVSLILITSPAKAWEFNEDGNVEGWNPARATVEAREGNLVISVNADTLDPFVNSPFGPYDANQITGVLIKMRWSLDPTSYGGPRIYFFPGAGGHNSIGYTPPSDPNAFSVVLADFLADTGWENDNKWEGQINNIRLDLADNVPQDYTVEIDWIRLESLYLDNETFEWTNMKGWDVREGAPEDFNDTELENVYNGSFALKITGSGGWHALGQAVKGGLEMEKGTRKRSLDSE